MRFKMSIKAFKKVREPVRKTRSQIKIEKRVGIPFLIQRLKKRKSFAIGFLIAVFLFSSLSAFIWRIDIEGCEKVSEKDVLQQLEGLGLKVGSLRFGKDVYFLQNEVLKKQKDLSWIWVDIKGTRAIVSVKEKVKAPRIEDDTVPSNIVAKRSGLITRVIALNGEAAVREGDVVDEGELLISGVVDLESAGVKYTASRGEITARTWYTKGEEFPFVKTEYFATGKKLSKNKISLFGFEVPLYVKNEIPFEYFDKDKKTTQPGIGRNFFLPIVYEKNVYYEKNKIETKLTTDAALVYYGNIIKNKLEKEIPADAKIVSRDIKHTICENGKIYIEAVYECIEDIGKNVKIENGG